jgi:hypothetical protein
MDTLAAALVEPLCVQDGVNRFGGRPRLTPGSRPGIAKPLRSLAPADKTRAMPRRKSDRLIEEEKLGPASADHNRSAPAFVVAAADEPCLGGPAPVQQSFRRRIMDYAAIAGEHAPLRYGDNLAKRCDTVL